jgi:hypothetical protein
MADTVFGFKLENRRAAWLVIGGLAAVLFAVLVLDEGESEAPDAAAASSVGSARNAGTPGDATSVGAPRGAPSGSSRSVRKIRQWPEIDLADVLKQNPFMLSDQATEELALQTGEAKETLPTDEEIQAALRQKRLGETLDELRRTGVSAIFRTAQGNAAVIGNRTLKEGDVIDGVRIVSISDKGIVVEPMNSP